MNDYKELIEKLEYCDKHSDCANCPNIFECDLSNKVCIDAIEQLVKERDAALADVPKCCLYCSKQIECEMPCVYPDSECKEFEWRGVTDEIN